MARQTDADETRTASDRFPTAQISLDAGDYVWIDSGAVREFAEIGEGGSQGCTVVEADDGAVTVEYPRHGETITATIDREHVRETDLQEGDRVSYHYDSCYSDSRVEKTGEVAAVKRTRGGGFDAITVDVDGDLYRIRSTGSVSTTNSLQGSTSRQIGDDAVVERVDEQDDDADTLAVDVEEEAEELLGEMYDDDDDEPATDGGDAKLLADGRGRLEGVDERDDVVDDPVDRSGEVRHISAIRQGDVVEVERGRDVLPIRITTDHIHGNFAEGVVDETTEFAGDLLVEDEPAEIFGVDERSRWAISAGPIERLSLDDSPTIVATDADEPDGSGDDSDDDDPDAGAADSGHASRLAAQFSQADDDLLAEIREQRDEQDDDDVVDEPAPNTGDALGDFDLDEHDQQFGDVDDVDPDSVTRWQAGGVAVDRGDGPVTDGGIVVADDGAEIIDDDDVDGAVDAEDQLLADGRGDVIVAGDGAEILGDGSGNDRQPNGAAGSTTGMADTSDAWRDDVSARLGRLVDELTDAALLTELQALAWVLRDVEGESRAAAADVLGCSKSTLDKHLSTARKKLSQVRATVDALQEHGIDLDDVDPDRGRLMTDGGEDVDERTCRADGCQESARHRSAYCSSDCSPDVDLSPDGGVPETVEADVPDSDETITVPTHFDRADDVSTWFGGVPDDWDVDRVYRYDGHVRAETYLGAGVWVEAIYVAERGDHTDTLDTGWVVDEVEAGHPAERDGELGSTIWQRDESGVFAKGATDSRSEGDQ